jgi:isocitrate/isopropylmalate dehydrogenase
MNAIETATSSKILTRDLGGEATTKSFTDAVIENL